jgi:hypothetical protein
MVYYCLSHMNKFSRTQIALTATLVPATSTRYCYMTHRQAPATSTSPCVCNLFLRPPLQLRIQRTGIQTQHSHIPKHLTTIVDSNFSCTQHGHMPFHHKIAHLEPLLATLPRPQHSATLCSSNEPRPCPAVYPTKRRRSSEGQHLTECPLAFV